MMPPTTMARTPAERLHALLAHPPETTQEWERLIGEEVDRLDSDDPPKPDPQEIDYAKYSFREGDTITCKILSDGTAGNTVIVDADDGKPLRYVQAVAFHAEVGQNPTCVLTLLRPPVEIGPIEATVKVVEPEVRRV